jgi:Xaa-Pro aminopeptidase
MSAPAGGTAKLKRGRLIFAAGVECPEMLYATGLPTPDPFLWYSLRSESTAVLSALEIGRAGKQIRAGVSVMSISQARQAWGLKGGRAAPAALITALSRQSGVSHWQVPQTFPLGLARELERNGLKLQPAALFRKERRCKSPAEINRIREALGASEAGMEKALQVLRESAVNADRVLTWQGRVLSAERLRGEIDAALTRAGATAGQTITAPGVQAADPHCQGSGPIRQGEPVVIDIFPRLTGSGYWGDLTRTVVKGRAPAPVRRAFKAVRAAQTAAQAAIRAGVKACAVHKIAAETLAEHGFRTRSKGTERPYGFFHGLGHGIGLQIHEEPRLAKGVQTRLQPGDVVTVEPGLYYPEWGGVRLENVVLVKQHDCEDMTRLPQTLEIA